MNSLARFRPRMKLHGVNVVLVMIVAFTIPTVFAAPPMQQAYIKASNSGLNDNFGQSLAIDGDTLVVAAPYESSAATGVNGNQNDNSASGAGAAYVFVRNGTNWVPQAYLKPSNTDANDRFGIWVAVSSNTVVIGALQEDSATTQINGNASDNSASSAGAAYVFVREGTNWTQQAYLKAANANAGDRFGSAVGISGDTIVVGAQGEDSSSTGVNGNAADNTHNDAGAAYVFVRTGTNWSQQAYVKPAYQRAPTSGGIQFGRAVAISGNTIVVGALGEFSSATGVNGDPTDTNAVLSGAAYVFVRNGTNWTQQAYLKASNTDPDDSFGGVAVAVSGDTILVGANREDSNATGVNGNQYDNSATDSGAAYVFVRNGTNWTQQAYLKASNLSRRFGISVSVSGNTAVVGADNESSSGIGINGNQNDTNAFWSGAAYVFARRGTNWSQEAYLKASNAEAYDYFGYWVGTSGDSVVVGAMGEDSNATGANGNQLDNSVNLAGAAYVFTGFGCGPELTIAHEGGGKNRIGFNAIAGFTYQLECASDVNGPWTSNLSVTANTSGLLELKDTNAPPNQAFYRVRQP